MDCPDETARADVKRCPKPLAVGKCIHCEGHAGGCTTDAPWSATSLGAEVERLKSERDAAYSDGVTAAEQRMRADLGSTRAEVERLKSERDAAYSDGVTAAEERLLREKAEAEARYAKAADDRNAYAAEVGRLKALLDTAEESAANRLRETEDILRIVRGDRAYPMAGSAAEVARELDARKAALDSLIMEEHRAKKLAQALTEERDSLKARVELAEGKLAALWVPFSLREGLESAEDFKRRAEGFIGELQDERERLTAEVAELRRRCERLADAFRLAVEVLGVRP